MKDFLNSGRVVFLDMLSTVFFLVLYLLTKSISLSVTLGIALGIAQIAWHIARKDKVDALQWMSLALVILSGGATLVTQDPRFIMVKPSIIYLVVGFTMLQRGWMNRYLPADALRLVPDFGIAFGYIWSGLMFCSAVLNLFVAWNFSIVAWASVMSVYAIVSKLALFCIQYALMRFVGGRRFRASQSQGERFNAG